ncbi:MAG: PAS domain-containing protein, partial [Burkholderiaceae bacterium]
MSSDRSSPRGAPPRAPHPLLARQLRRLGLDRPETVPDATRWGEVVSRVGRRYARLQATLDATRRSRRQATAALADANQRLREERDELEAHVRERTAQLEQSRADLLGAQVLAGLGTWSYSYDTHTLDVSEPLERLLGIDPETRPASLEALLDFVVGEDRPGAQRALQAALRTERRLTGELRIRDARGGIRWFATTIVSTTEADGRIRHVRGAMLDVTARRDAESRAQRLATHDDLTGLPNRSAFIEEVGRAIGEAR